ILPFKTTLSVPSNSRKRRPRRHHHTPHILLPPINNLNMPLLPLVMPLPGTILLPNSTTMVKKLNKLPPAHISLTLTHPTGTGTIQNIRMQHLQSNRLKRYMRPHRRTALQHPIPKQPTPTLHVVEGRKNQRREPQARQYEHGDDEIESRATNKSAVESKSANNHVDSSLIVQKKFLACEGTG
ncbi:hypothetical protein J3E74DRAFT_441744, partial [Bipolaris maydis]